MSAASVGEDFPRMLQHAREVLAQYEAIPTGAFGAIMIRQDIAEAEAALASGDVVRIVKAYAALKEIR